MKRTIAALLWLAIAGCIFNPPSAPGDLDATCAACVDGLSFPDADSGLPPIDGGEEADACGPSGCIMPPMAMDDTATVTAGQTILIDVLANDRGDSLRILTHGQPRLGLMNREGEQLRYRARVQVAGLDEVDYSISDRFGAVASATVRIRVVGENDPPVVQNISESTFTERPIQVRLIGSDPNNDPLQFQVREPPQSGTLTPSPRGAEFLIYTPNRMFTGTDRFTYFAEDAALESATATVTITVADPPGGWADDNWARRRRITFDNGMNNGNLDGFVVLVRLDPTRIDYSRAAADGADLRFFDGTTAIPFEIESWVSGGESLIWVRVPRIDRNSNTDNVTLYYGNLAPPAPPNPEGVWSGFDAVLHLSGSFADSTAAQRNGTSTTAAGAPGAIAGGASFDGDAAIDLPTSFFATDQGTLGAWVRTTTSARGLIVYGTSDNSGELDGFGPEEEVHLGFEPDGRVLFFIEGNGSADLELRSDVALNDGAWHWVVVAFRQGQPSMIYADGRLIEQRDHDARSFVASAALRLGSPTARVSRFNGFLDEVRFHPMQRNAAWIEAEHRSMIDAFATFGPEDAGL